MTNPTRLLASCLLVAILAAPLAAQGTPAAVELPQPSPLATLNQRVGLTDIAISWSRPGVKGRHIFGNVVPRDVLWRTGANAATKVSFSTPVKVEGVAVPAGQYALFTIPKLESWTVILNKDAAQSGTGKYDAKQDVLRVEVQPVTMAESVETFRIDVQQIRDESAVLVLEWEETRVPIRIEVEVLASVIPKIQAVVASGVKQPPIQYFRWAQFFFEHGRELAQAEAWVDTGLAEPSEVRWLLLHAKAKLAARRGDAKAARAAAEESNKLAVSREGPDGAIARQNREILASLGK